MDLTGKKKGQRLIPTTLVAVGQNRLLGSVRGIGDGLQNPRDDDW